MHWRNSKNTPEGRSPLSGDPLETTCRGENPRSTRQGFSFDYREVAVVAFSILVIGIPPIGVTLGLICWMLFFA